MTDMTDTTERTDATGRMGATGADPHERSAAMRAVAVAAVVLFGAIFGFFYAWVCSTMWGLDDADPRVAIGAMQAMNGSVRNAVFFPAFFLTPVVGAVAAGLLRRHGRRRAAALFAAASFVYLVGGLILTMTVNVPMNEDLAEVVIPDDLAAAGAIWDDYSGRWQVFNQIRTVASGLALVLAATGLTLVGRRDA